MIQMLVLSGLSRQWGSRLNFTAIAPLPVTTGDKWPLELQTKVREKVSQSQKRPLLEPYPS